MKVVASLGFVWMIVLLTSSVAAAEKSQPLLGAWTTHHSTTFLTISIEPGGNSLVYWDYGGSHSVYRTRWKEMKNGLMIEGLPRFRFWTTGGNGRPLMRMEPFDPGLEIADDLRFFPLEHQMGPVATEERRYWANRILPSGWEAEMPPANK